MRNGEHRLSRWIKIAAAAGTIVTTIYVVQSGGVGSWAINYPKAAILPLASWITDFLNFLANDFLVGDVPFSNLTRGFSWFVEQPLVFLQGILASGFTIYGTDGSIVRIPALPWTGVMAVASIFAWWSGGAKTLIIVLATFLYFAVFGLWEASMMTFASIIVSVAVSVILGIALGVIGYRSKFANIVLRGLYDIMQTMPVFSYLVPVVLFFGFSPVAGLIATMIFALPPMARVATLALHRVPPNISDLAEITGCTGRQKIMQVMLPASRETLLIGLNQVIMLSLAMVIVASVIGAGGLGANVYRGLKSLRIGEAVEAGVAISLMAIMLDRVSKSLTMRRTKHSTALESNIINRHPVFVVSVSTLMVSMLLSVWFPFLQHYPDSASISTGGSWNQLITVINENYHREIGIIRDGMIIYIMRPIKELFLSLPWVGVLVATVATSLALGGFRLALLCCVMLMFIVVTGYWTQAMISLYLVTVAVPIALFIAFPIGLCAAIIDPVDRIVTVVIDVVQTIPTFVYLIPVVMVFGIGEFPALLAIVLYAVAPTIRYTKQGLRNVSGSVIEAAELSGASRGQRLWLVEVPVARPVILLGVSQTILMAFSMLVITALVGTRGLEYETLIAISKVRPGEGVVAGLGISFLSIIADRMVTAGSHIFDRRVKVDAVSTVVRGVVVASQNRGK